MPTIYEADGWSTDGPNILAPENLSLLRTVLDDVAPVVVEQWHYRGSQAPDRFVFDSYEKLERYVRESAVPGDLFYMWNFTECCPRESAMVTAKMPDAEGRVPRRRAY